MPELLINFFNNSDIDVDMYYQAFKYPLSTKNAKFDHDSLKMKGSQGVQFYKELDKDLSLLRHETVEFGRKLLKST